MNIYYIADRIAQLKPGQEIIVDLGDVQIPIHAIQSGFTRPDWVMESIVGSAYNLTYWFQPATGFYAFHRLSEAEKKALNGERSYTSPDRRR